MVDIQWADCGHLVGAYKAHSGPIHFIPQSFRNIVDACWAHTGRILDAQVSPCRLTAAPPARLRDILSAYQSHTGHIGSSMRANRFHSIHIRGTKWACSGRIGGTLGAYRFSSDRVDIEWATSRRIVGAYMAHHGPMDFTPQWCRHIVGAHCAHSGHIRGTFSPHRSPP